MKKIVFTIVTLFFVSWVTAQNVKLPESVTNSFMQKMGNDQIKKEVWSKSAEGWYVVNFTLGGKQNYINYYENGAILEHGLEVKYDDLSKEVKSSFLSKYSEEDVSIVYEIFSGAAPERNRIDIKNGNTTKSLYYSLKGNLYMQK